MYAVCRSTLHSTLYEPIALESHSSRTLLEPNRSDRKEARQCRKGSGTECGSEGERKRETKKKNGKLGKLKLAKQMAERTHERPCRKKRLFYGLWWSVCYSDPLKITYFSLFFFAPVQRLWWDGVWWWHSVIVLTLAHNGVAHSHAFSPAFT